MYLVDSDFDSDEEEESNADENNHIEEEEALSNVIVNSEASESKTGGQILQLDDILSDDDMIKPLRDADIPLVKPLQRLGLNRSNNNSNKLIKDPKMAKQTESAKGKEDMAKADNLKKDKEKDATDDQDPCNALEKSSKTT